MIKNVCILFNVVLFRSEIMSDEGCSIEKVYHTYYIRYNHYIHTYIKTYMLIIHTGIQPYIHASKP